jgi:thiamine pyrophosphokinase
MDYSNAWLIILGGDLPPIIPNFWPPQGIIAVDKGADNAFRLGLIPDLLLGDLDSISETALNYYWKEDVPTVTYPEQKDFTDGQAALAEAKKRGAKKLVILAAFGGREDHHLMNIFSAAKAAGDFEQIILPGDGFTSVICPRKFCLSAADGELISLLALSPKVTGVCTEGLLYQLQNEDLSFGESRGLSNILKSPNGSVSHASGTLLLIQTINRNSKG